MTKQWAELASIETVSGTAHRVPDEWRGFVTVRAIAVDGSVMMGQIDVATCRSMAMQFLETAEAAEQEAIVFRVLTRGGVDENAVAGLVDLVDERWQIVPTSPAATAKAVEQITAAFRDLMRPLIEALRKAADAIQTVISANRPWFDAWMIELNLTTSEDAMAFDHQPGRCWRCDAADGVTPVGLCAVCSSVLQS